ncbi:MAG: hypothetical protein M0P57_07020 [Syntrophales bacterium]|nr:hypothetical protein [Syntrophales bacterium]MDY0044878.1 hypothetical protein [Syntrophales bacterium]
MKSLHERIAWSLSVVKEDQLFEKGIRDVDLAHILGISDNTLALYRKGGGVIKASVVETLSLRYGFSPAWLLKGEGEPWPGARYKYPEICGEKKSEEMQSGMSSVTEAKPEYSSFGSEIAEDLMRAAGILGSATSYATALRTTIAAFAGVLKGERSEESENELERKFNQYDIRLEELKNEIASLRDRISRIT